jgi:uncharacterized phage infection (PIP) family protein YhgE
MDENAKKSLLKQLADNIVEWDTKLDELKKKAMQASDDLKKDYSGIAEDIKIRRAEAEKKIEELKKSGTEGWAELKIGAEKAVDDLSEAIKKAVSKFK